jgi:DNA-directed RNA polymerase II subunit RPB2
MEADLPWKIVDRYFADGPMNLIDHHTNSFDEFYTRGLPSILREKNPIVFNKEYDDSIKTHRFKCDIYIGGRDGRRIYYGKPVIYNEDNQHYMYPNDARMRNMTYGITVHYDVELVFTIIGDDGLPVNTTEMVERVFMGRFPIMVGSKLCITNGLADTTRFQLGECRNDRGGYFIIDGKERVVIPQERFADNMTYVRRDPNEIYSYSINIRSVSEDASKPVRTMAVYIVAPTTRFTGGQIVVNIPNVRSPMPLFTVMRALGVVDDMAIIERCLLDLKMNRTYIDYFVPSIHDAGTVFNQETALKFIASFTKHKTVASALEIITDYFLPHVGEMNFGTKAYFLGNMVKQMLDVVIGRVDTTDRDSFKYKRVDTTGRLLYDLINEYYALQQREMFLSMDRDYFYHTGEKNAHYFKTTIVKHMGELKDRTVEAGVSKAFKGNWGGSAHTKKEGVVQVLNRLSFNSAISHLRKLNLPLDSSAKVVGPRNLHGSQFGIIDPVDTPDGGNIGLHKHMAIMAKITSGVPRQPIVDWLTSAEGVRMQSVEDMYPKSVSQKTVVMVNGTIAGVVYDPKKTVEMVRRARRAGDTTIGVYTSCSWDIEAAIIEIWCDGGRLTRPVFYTTDDGKSVSYDMKGVVKSVLGGTYSWSDMIGGGGGGGGGDGGDGGGDEDGTTNMTGGAKKKDGPKKAKPSVDTDTSAVGQPRIRRVSALVEYIDTNEQEAAYIAMYPEDFELVRKENGRSNHTHVEIHPSFMLGVMGNQIVFPENNQLPRDLFSCGQSKQAVSLYHSNYQSRIDKMGVVLNAGQIPLVKSRYMKHISGEEHPYGENVIVAIMSYNGYNVEDSILFNSGSVDRGMFNMTYYNSYESYESSSTISKQTTNTTFGPVDGQGIVGTRPGYDYSQLDENGLVKENTVLDDKMVVIGRSTVNDEEPDRRIDASVTVKKGQLGFVDKVFMTEGEEGFRIAKVRMRERRVPAIGDKFCSRCGQKGTVGLVIPEADMPYTSDGMKPDIIINPHALPSRMTIGQLIESLLGKAATVYGGFGDCTAFVNNGPKHEMYGGMLRDAGLSSTGCHIMYNGMTGEMLDSDIYVGPTYYMRLKHMVKDKINYRARGPMTALTRQPVHGRANDGGLRIGEMERDGVVGHGASAFLNESMMERGDEYRMAVCNVTGGFAIYNAERDIFLSPDADGPIQYKVDTEGGMAVDVVSKHGRSFSVIRVPYSFKLMAQELQAMNIRMRIITDENINQIPELSYSNNIDRLVGEVGVKTDVVAIRNRRLGEKEVPGRPTTPINSPDSPDYMPGYVPGTPDYSPGNSPDYPPGSSPDYPPSPGTPGTTPDYPPGAFDESDHPPLKIDDSTHDMLSTDDIEDVNILTDIDNTTVIDEKDEASDKRRITIDLK